MQESIHMNISQQLELGLRERPGRGPARTVSARLARAQWWFARMRESVAEAMEWEPAGTGPQEGLLPGGGRNRLKN